MSQQSENTKEEVLYLVNPQGHCSAVQLSSALWDEVQAHVLAVAKKRSCPDDPFDKAQPLAALADLKTYWDFTYPYDGHVHCDACHTTTENWEEDPAHPFHLSNANIGGLLVFRCRCGATVRKKHFHKKVVMECTPNNA